MFPGFDPSKLDPRLIQEVSELMQSLPTPQIMRMQSIMHNSMAGFDVSKEMQEFESSLPPGFREKLTGIMMRANPGDLMASVSGSSPAFAKTATETITPVSDIDDARLTLLKAVRDRTLSVEDAFKVLFPES